MLWTFNVSFNDVALVDCTGPIPKELGQLSFVEELNLSRNKLEGEIETLCVFYFTYTLWSTRTDVRITLSSQYWAR